jgi:hypothetical protein
MGPRRPAHNNFQMQMGPTYIPGDRQIFVTPTLQRDS